jgi:hypothetical protein
MAWRKVWLASKCDGENAFLTTKKGITLAVSEDNAYLCSAKKTDVRRLMPDVSSEESLGALSPQPILPRRTGCALALPDEPFAEWVSTISGIAEKTTATFSGIRLIRENVSTETGTKAKTDNLCRNKNNEV